MQRAIPKTEPHKRHADVVSLKRNRPAIGPKTEVVGPLLPRSSPSSMTEDEYLALRLDHQITWYDTKSKKAKISYYILRFVELGAAAAIPFLSGFATTLFYVPSLIGLLGIIIAICAGILSLAQLQMRWLQYRTLAGALQKEKYQFMIAVVPYNIEERFPLLVKRVEDLLFNENTRWAHGFMKPNSRSSDSHSIVAGSNRPGGGLLRLIEALRRTGGHFAYLFLLTRTLLLGSSEC